MVDIVDLCEMNGCEGEAKHVTSTETKIIQVCKDCYNKIYKK